ncbi:hypothetical protein BT69DRAFT_1358183 [Atractiella rhizophila]|nr:hypothetical protein BT69DRAFT_1358183 [Atractiella rhizophila]
MGRKGESYTFVLPGKEREWIKQCEEEIEVSLGEEEGIGDVLRGGYGGESRAEWEKRATDVQMGFERWVVASSSNTELSKRAFTSHLRAYSTHPSKEKEFFHIRNLHLGHLAKSFGLREAPGDMQMGQKSEKKEQRRSDGVKSYKGVSLTGREKGEFQIGNLEEIEVANAKRGGMKANRGNRNKKRGRGRG